MSNKFLLGALAILIVSGASVFALIRNISPLNVYPDNTYPTEEEQVFCTMEAKLCPDGSYVGRTGKDCHFADCPIVQGKTESISLGLGKTGTIASITITPKEIISDSRCPVGVQCVWEGTVDVKTSLVSKDLKSEEVIRLNSPVKFGDQTITLVKVTPGQKSGVKVQDSEYLFTFEVISK